MMKNNNTWKTSDSSGDNDDNTVKLVVDEKLNSVVEKSESLKEMEEKEEIDDYKQITNELEEKEK